MRDFRKIVEKEAFYGSAIFFDFDRTLCAHGYVRTGEEDFFWNELANQGKMHENDAPLPCMQAFVKTARERKLPVVCISHTITNLRDEFNKNFLDRYYGGMEYLTVGNPEKKVDMMKAWIKAHKIDERIPACLVDDTMHTLEAAKRAGFHALHLSDIALWYETRESKGCGS